ncbi:MAG: ATP-dependent DNA ligase [bacterium]|nr:ATP-dependent DNA ligase [bacterium]
MKLPVLPPVAPMLARAAESLPTGEPGEMWFEPKWDGFRAVIFRDGDAVEIGSRNERLLTRYFPELVGPLRARLPQRCVLDGELVIVGSGGGLDFDALGARIHPAASRIGRLARETPARFVAFDILALADRDLTGLPFAERRAVLVDVAAGFAPPVHLTPATTDRAVATGWFERFEGAGLDGIIAKPATGVYEPGRRTQFKIKHRHTAECVVAGYRIHRSGDGVGSLLLGLHDSRGVLHYVGAASGFAARQRVELADLLAPYRVDDGVGHPWTADGAQGRLPGTPNRWRSGTGDWVPLAGAPVAEVSYDSVLSGRFRHSARLLRWRSDRLPASCGYAQLVRTPPVELAEIFGAADPITG